MACWRRGRSWNRRQARHVSPPSFHHKSSTRVKNSAIFKSQPAPMMNYEVLVRRLNPRTKRNKDSKKQDQHLLSTPPLDRRRRGFGGAGLCPTPQFLFCRPPQFFGLLAQSMISFLSCFFLISRLLSECGEVRLPTPAATPIFLLLLLPTVKESIATLDCRADG
jgi:hypothetical protein